MCSAPGRPGHPCTFVWLGYKLWDSYNSPPQLHPRLNNLLVSLAELGKTIYLHLLVYYKGYNSRTSLWRRFTGQDMIVGGGRDLPHLHRHIAFPASQHVHLPGSSSALLFRFLFFLSFSFFLFFLNRDFIKWTLLIKSLPIGYETQSLTPAFACLSSRSDIKNSNSPIT